MEFIGLIISIAVTIYLVVDAPKHGKSPVLWGVLGFIFSLLTLGIYWIQTGRKVIGWILTIVIIIGVILILFAFFVLFWFIVDSQ
ncbi:hypothetical protein ERJ70_05995 [Sediminibacillus dalangtanensis]|uniref:YesK-like protein n=1 Tax=Sediminibacillus dalangtanensis TaxID=2729421 RepID=A0ABX7VSW0_9BACI|nr:hypothetical protein [Sediminibacillus dalangtanensis]QTM98890.1 hypothetical protein ERJ70_05995 [Sediminibacillus dalangtanensis]